MVSKRLRCTPVLEDFVRYCNARPDLRFYQALLNWSGRPGRLVFYEQSANVVEPGITDPYSWEGKES
jgi:hypothetical protein